jgi:hypothetical protein
MAEEGGSLKEKDGLQYRKVKKNELEEKDLWT